MNEPVNVLKEALLTEKATMLSANFNQYVFSVFPEATIELMLKTQLRKLSELQ